MPGVSAALIWRTNSIARAQGPWRWVQGANAPSARAMRERFRLAAGSAGKWPVRHTRRVSPLSRTVRFPAAKPDQHARRARINAEQYLTFLYLRTFGELRRLDEAADARLDLHRGDRFVPAGELLAVAQRPGHDLGDADRGRGRHGLGLRTACQRRRGEHGQNDAGLDEFRVLHGGLLLFLWAEPAVIPAARRLDLSTGLHEAATTCVTGQ